MARKPKIENKETKETTITLRDFKAWLQGVEDMQEAGWTPNAEQWKRIRHKIDLITAVVAVEVETVKPSEVKSLPKAGKANTQNFPPAAPPVIPTSGLDAAPVVAAKGGLKVEDGRIKTPSDLSGEKYTAGKSPFV